MNTDSASEIAGVPKWAVERAHDCAKVALRNFPQVRNSDLYDFERAVGGSFAALRREIDTPTPVSPDAETRLAELPDCMMPDGGESCEGYRFMLRLAKRERDAHAALEVEREREACAAIADADAELGRADLDDPELDGLAGARILAAERIAAAIRSRSVQAKEGTDGR